MHMPAFTDGLHVYELEQPVRRSGELVVVRQVVQRTLPRHIAATTTASPARYDSDAAVLSGSHAVGTASTAHATRTPHARTTRALSTDPGTASDRETAS